MKITLSLPIYALTLDKDEYGNIYATYIHI